MDYFFVFKTLFFLIISFWSVYLVGHLLLILFYKNSTNQLFYKLVIGVVLIPTIYAIYKTNGITILSLNIVVLLMFIYHKRKVFFINSISSFWKQFLMFDKGLIATNVALIVFYFIQLNSMFDLSTGIPLAIDKDYSYYSRIAGYLRDFGVENRNIEYFLNEKGGVSTYHYAELWMCALMSNLFKIHTQYTLYIITYPLLLSIVYSGIITLIFQAKQLARNATINIKNVLAIYFLPYLFFTFSMFAILYPNNVEVLKMDIWTSSILSMPKLINIYIFGICILLSLLKNNYYSVSIFACLLGISYSTVIPALFLTIFLFLIYKIVFNKLKILEATLSFYPIIVTSILMLVLYAFFGERDSALPSLFEIIDNYKFFASFKTAVNVFGKTIIQIVITASPLILLFIFLKQKINIEFFSFLFFLILSSLIIYAFLHSMHDAVQLWSNIYMPMINLFAYTFILVGLIDKQKKFSVVKMYMLIILAFGLVMRYPYRNSNQTLPLKKVNSINANFPRFAFIKEQEDYNDYFSNFEQVYAGATYSLMRKYDPLYIVCLSTNNINVENEKLNRFNKNTTFEKYKEQLQSSGLSLNHEEAQIKFIKEYNIDYLLSYKYRDLPIHLQPYFENQSIGYVDGFSIHKRIDD